MPKNTILVFATESMGCSDVWKALRDNGYEVHVLGDLTACLEMLQKVDVDLAMLDVCSDFREALDTLAAFRSITANLPVVLMGGEYSSESMVAAYEGGASAFVSRPLKLEHVLNYIRTLLEGGR